MLSIFLGSAAAILLIVGILYLQLQKTKKEQKEELREEEQQHELEESVDSQEHECCGGHCNGECNCQHELEEEHECCGHCGEGCNCEEIFEEEPVLFEKEPIMPMIIEEEEIVYINEGASSSKKYHNRPDAHHMDGAVAISRSEADRQGFVPCGKCFKK